MIGGRRPISGRKPGDKRVRVERHHAPYFRYTGPGQLTAKAAASAPTTTLGVIRVRVKGALLGRPLANEEEIGQRLSKTKALAIFSSDAISSSAYATEEIILAFVLAGVAGAAFNFAVPVAIAIAALLGIVAFSYRQVCLAYPTGGGSYSVSKANFGRMASLVAASALMIDYTLTVAVSTSSAVEQLSSAIPALDPYRVEVAILAIGLITLGNLRGLREAGNIFAIPTYLFLGSAFLMIAAGTFRIVFQGDTGPAPTPEVDRRHDPDGEGRDDPDHAPRVRRRRGRAHRHRGDRDRRAGVQAARGPERGADADGHGEHPRVLFVGITFLATSFHIMPIEEPRTTVIAQIASHVYGDGSVGFYLFQAFTALLLFLAANTSFAAFPRLAAILAEDGFIPRQFAFRGDRLAFSTGIILLGSVAARRGHRRRRLDPRADPAVRGRRVHRLHDLAGGHGPPLAPDQEPGLAAAADDQRRRLRAHRHHRHRRDLGEVHRRRLARAAAHPHARRRDAVHPARVRRPDDGARRPRRPRVRQAAPRAAGRDPRQRHQPLRRAGRDVRPVAGDRPVDDPGDVRDHRAGGGRGAPRTLGAAAAGHPAGHRRVALPGAGGAGRHLPRRPRPCLAAGPARPRRRSSSCPSTSPATGGTGCCTTRRPSASRPRSSGASTRSSRTYPIDGAITRTSDAVPNHEVPQPNP